MTCKHSFLHSVRYLNGTLNAIYASAFSVYIFSASAVFQHEVIEEEAHDEMDEHAMKTEETRSQIILDSRKVEEAKQLYLCHQVQLHLFSLLSEL